MAEFLSKLVVEELDDETWELKEILEYKSDIVGHVSVPSGFVTDFASVPRLPLAYLVAGNTAHAAAVVHDFLYQTHTCSKTQADKTFREAMAVSGVPFWRRNLMFVAVSLCGWSSYRSGPSRFTKLGN